MQGEVAAVGRGLEKVAAVGMVVVMARARVVEASGGWLEGAAQGLAVRAQEGLELAEEVARVEVEVGEKARVKAEVEPQAGVSEGGVEGAKVVEIRGVGLAEGMVKGSAGDDRVA